MYYVSMLTLWGDNWQLLLVLHTRVAWIALRAIRFLSFPSQMRFISLTRCKNLYEVAQSWQTYDSMLIPF